MSRKPKLPIPPPDPRVGAPAPAAVAGELPLSRLRPSPTNPRKSFDDAALSELADSLRRLGVLQPLTVRPVGDAPRWTGREWEGVEYFEVVAGERRFRAATLAGLPAVPVTVRTLTDEEVLECQLAENDQREDVLPSERAAAYRQLAERLGNVEDTAGRLGKPVSQVRDLVRLARLPAWALAAVDAQRLPVATAALVARVGGEESRKKAAACVLLNRRHPRELDATWNDADTWEEAVANPTCQGDDGDRDCLSFRETKDLLRSFQVELKAAPFSRKSLDLVPAAGSCDACPKRAGNDPEARAEGVRADVCLDPDCYRAKVEAYRRKETEKAAADGVEPVPEDFHWHPGDAHPPRGWCDPGTNISQTEAGMGLKLGTRQAGKTLGELLAAPGAVSIPSYLAFRPATGKPVRLVRAADARKALKSIGLERPAAEPPKRQVDEEWMRRAEEASPRAKAPAVPAGPSWKDVTTRVGKIAGKVLYEMGAENADGLEGLTALGDSSTNAAWEALKLLALAAFEEAKDEHRDHHLTDGVLTGVHFWGRDDDEKGVGPAFRDWLKGADPAWLIGFLLKAQVQKLAVAPLGAGDTARQALLDWAELDWDTLEEQARRELAGGPTADEKLAAAEKEQAAAPAEPAPPADRWESRSLESLDLKPGVELKLTTRGCVNLGQLAWNLDCHADLGLGPADLRDVRAALGAVRGTTANGDGHAAGKANGKPRAKKTAAAK